MKLHIITIIVCFTTLITHGMQEVISLKELVGNYLTHKIVHAYQDKEISLAQAHQTAHSIFSRIPQELAQWLQSTIRIRHGWQAPPSRTSAQLPLIGKHEHIKDLSAPNNCSAMAYLLQNNTSQTRRSILLHPEQGPLPIEVSIDMHRIALSPTTDYVALANAREKKCLLYNTIRNSIDKIIDFKGLEYTHFYELGGCSFSPDGNSLLFSAKGKTMHYNLANTQRSVVDGDISFFSHDGKYIISIWFFIGSTFFLLYDTQTNEPLQHAEFTSSLGVAARASKDMQYVLFGDEQGQIFLWSLHDNVVNHRNYKNRIAGITNIALSPDNQQIAVSDLDGNVHILNRTTGEILQSCNLFDSHANTQDFIIGIGFDATGEHIDIIRKSGITHQIGVASYEETVRHIRLAAQ